MVLSLKTFGTFAVRDASGAELALRTRKTRALLAYLAVNANKPQPRERLMSLLWSDRGEKQARQSLNDALRSIRHLSNDGVPTLIDSDAEQVTLHGAALDTDIGQFQVLADDDPASAVALYEGPFLDGLSVPDPAFDEWVRATRSELQDRACRVLGNVADVAAASGDLEAAIDFAKRLLSFDPLREDAHRRLMRLLHDSGDRTAALRQYRTCAELLEKELQIEPDEATKALFQKIRRVPRLFAESGLLPEFQNTPPKLPGKPSIAVLPFYNLGGDPAQEFFGDGMAEDIITELSRFHSLFVIARGSSFSFKGQLLDTREIAARLGVRYVLEGSIRTHGSRIRITAQLIDAETKNHIWAERYNRELEDTFAIQDEVTNAIVLAIAPVIDRSERQRAQRKPPENLDAWSQYQRGLTAYYLSTEAGLRLAATLFDRSTKIDASFAIAYAYAAASRNRLVLNYGPADSDTLIAESKEKLDTALALDAQDTVALFVTGVLESLRGNHDLAINRVEQAISLNPNSAYCHGIMAYVLRRAGRPGAAIDAIDRAMRLSPYDPATSMFLSIKVNAYFELEQYAECADWGRLAINTPGPYPKVFLFLAAALVYLGREDEAIDVVDRLKLQFPTYSLVSGERASETSQSDGYPRLVEILRQTGLAN
jgi:TolB-like protein/DNA-binding SARP family transcriptional activator